MANLYLFLYNAAVMVGWCMTMKIVVESWVNGLSSEDMWDLVEVPLKLAQTAAVMEIVHAAIGLVRSNPVTATMQVGSRLALLWGFTNRVAAARTHWSLYLMIASWSLVEVPRYAFYAIKQAGASVPYPIFVARYNFFRVRLEKLR